MQSVEVRAFGCLIDDLLPLCLQSQHTQEYKVLVGIKDNCMQPATFERPSFIAIVEQLALL
jgi:hypothetical protein